MHKVSLRGILEDFILQDSSLMDYLWQRIPVYSKSEVIGRVILFFIFLLPLWLTLKPVGISSIVVTLLMAHFINWFANGHGYQIFYSIIGLRFSPKKAKDYILRLKKEAKERCLHVMVYGSWSRCEATSRSDIDAFIVNVQGDTANGLRCALISLKYRILAIVKFLSVDIYVIDRVEYLRWREHVKSKERPIILHDPTGLIESIYGERKTDLNTFLNAIAETYKPL